MVDHDINYPPYTVSIPPDTGVCKDCVRELFDPSNRRFGHPFINCSCCGPGYTVASLTPFYRELSSMSCIDLCSDCKAETTAEKDRRFRSQTNSCPACGPRLSVLDCDGRRVYSRDPVQDTIAHLKMGRIVALKGTGGFHFICDGANEAAIKKLRKRCGRRKERINVLLPALTALGHFCHPSETEKSIISGKERPVVLIEKRDIAALAPSLWLDYRRPGFMLPQTPLHYLLFGSGLSNNCNHFFSNSYDKRHFHFMALAITDSALYVGRDTPATSESMLIKRVAHISDFFLVHDRKIAWPCEDSEIKEIKGVSHQDGAPAALILKRSGGFLPAPVYLNRSMPAMLACGTDHNSSFCLASGRSLFSGPPSKELDTARAIHLFRDTIDHFTSIFKINPEYIVVEPDDSLHSARYGRNLKKNCIRVPHCHAHLASVIAEHSLSGDVIGILLDRSEAGDNGQLWGGEIFTLSAKRYLREGHFKPYRLPGGKITDRQPWRVATALLYQTFGDNFIDRHPIFTDRIEKESALRLKEMIDTETDSPLTTGASAFLEAFSSLLDLQYVTAFEGEASMRLEDIADRGEEGRFGFDISKNGVIDFSPMIEEVVQDIVNRKRAALVSAKFHNTIVTALVQSCLKIRKSRELTRVVLSGEVFQNTHLLGRLSLALGKKGFTVFLPRQLPINDGGIAPGQIAVALDRIDKA